MVDGQPSKFDLWPYNSLCVGWGNQTLFSMRITLKQLFTFCDARNMLPLIYALKVFTLFNEVNWITYRLFSRSTVLNLGVRRNNTSHLWFTVMTLSGVIIQASEASE